MTITSQRAPEAARPSASNPVMLRLVVVPLCALILFAVCPGDASERALQNPQSSGNQSQQISNSSAGAQEIPRGKKLMLKDGNFQLVREYQVEGDRIRYYSLDRSQWEEIPVALVDWDATKKEEAAEAKREENIVAAAHAREREREVQPLDIDASLEVAPGTFLPPGDGLFIFNGKKVSRLKQAETSGNTSKRRVIEQVLVPVPLVPSRQTISLDGARAKFRVNSGQPEFYMRTSDGSESDVELVRAKVHGAKRQIENIDRLMKQRNAVRDTVPIQRWQVAQGVYRFTVEQALEPGEYAVIEVVGGEEMNLYAWDFGVDSSASRDAANREKQR